MSNTTNNSNEQSNNIEKKGSSRKPKFYFIVIYILSILASLYLMSKSGAATQMHSIFESHLNIILKYGLPYIMLQVGIISLVVFLVRFERDQETILFPVSLLTFLISTLIYLLITPWKYSEIFITVSTSLLIPTLFLIYRKTKNINQ